MEPDKIVLFALPVSILWLLAVQLTARPFLVHALLAPLYVLVGVDLYLIGFFHTRLNSSTLAMLVDGLRHAGDPSRSDLGPFGLWLAAIAALYALGLAAIRRATLPSPGHLRIAVAAAFVALYGALIVSRTIVHERPRDVSREIVAHERSRRLGATAPSAPGARARAQQFGHWQLREVVETCEHNE